jgi:signal peptidase I
MMMLIPLTKVQIQRIANNIKKVVKTGDITFLSKQSYNFLYLASGFIAHYDHSGFMYYYKNTEDLRGDILSFQSQNQWDNFRKGERDYEYYMAKKECYNAICEAIKEVPVLGNDISATLLN